MRDLKENEKVLNRLPTSADKQTLIPANISKNYAHRHKEVISTLLPQSTELHEKDKIQGSSCGQCEVSRLWDLTEAVFNGL